MPGDGYRGWPEHAPFDAIILNPASGQVSQPPVERLKIGGRIVMPVGEGFWSLIIVTKDEKGVTQREVLPTIRDGKSVIEHIRPPENRNIIIAVPCFPDKTEPLHFHLCCPFSPCSVDDRIEPALCGLTFPFSCGGFS